MYNVRIVIIHFITKNIIRAELQVKLTDQHWTPIKTICKRKSIVEVDKLVDHEMTKLRMRASLDWAIALDPEIRTFTSNGNDYEQE